MAWARHLDGAPDPPGCGYYRTIYFQAYHELQARVRCVFPNLLLLPLHNIWVICPTRRASLYAPPQLVRRKE
jgi:hypothetical protein